MSEVPSLTLAELRARLSRVRAELATAEAALIEPFIAQLGAWKENDETPHRLSETLGRILGHTWFASNETHTAVYELLAAFQHNVRCITGMTMNERLFIFDLCERWDHAGAEERLMLYRKLEATP